MFTASLYEGYLERKHRIAVEARDLELARNDANHKQPVGTFVYNIIILYYLDGKS